MTEKYLYLAIDFFSIIFPLLFSFHPRLRFYKKWRYLLPSLLIPAILFIIWDMLFTKMGVWGFNPRYITGIYFFNLPLEEVLFFICIPYACAFTYESVTVISGRERINPKLQLLISNLLSFGLVAMGIVNYERWYTGVTFIITGSSIFVVHRLLRVDFMGRFYFAFLFILIPFFFVNGILTGTGIEEPVVWYNNSENLGIRMGTIPFEDTFYGLLLILMNIFLLEYMKKYRSVVTVKP